MKPVPFVEALDATGFSVRQFAAATGLPVATAGVIVTTSRRAAEDSLPPEEYARTNIFSARVIANVLGREVADLFANHTDVVGGLR